MIHLANKMSKESESSKKKVKAALKKGDLDLAKIHAESAIRQKNTSRNFERLASRVEAVSARVKTAGAVNQMNMNMGKVTKAMNTVLNSMNPEKIANVLDQFEEQNETLDVRTDFMDAAISNTVAGATPQDEVQLLLEAAGDEVGLDVKGAFESDLPTLKTVAADKDDAEGVKDDV